MPFYEYECPDHGRFETMVSGDESQCPTPVHLESGVVDCGQTSRRIWAFTTGAVLQEHYNPAFGRNISSINQAKELAKVASAEQSERLGMTVNYELTDIHDHEAAGITLDEKKEYAARTAEHVAKQGASA
jgi:hypothetical protein